MTLSIRQNDTHLPECKHILTLSLFQGIKSHQKAEYNIILIGSLLPKQIVRSLPWALSFPLGLTIGILRAKGALYSHIEIPFGAPMESSFHIATTRTYHFIALTPQVQNRTFGSPSGNRTLVSRVTGGDTYHYTNEESWVEGCEERVVQVRRANITIGERERFRYVHFMCKSALNQGCQYHYNVLYYKIVYIQWGSMDNCPSN
jgi:hypothetical protein